MDVWPLTCFNLYNWQEHKQESLRIEHQKILEEAEKKRLESESNKRKQLRIQLEIEERELEEAQALLLEAERRSKKKGKKPVLDGVSFGIVVFCLLLLLM